MPKRHLIPCDRIIVVLDTSPVRDLAQSGREDWVQTFAAMVNDGYSFSLADATAAELLTQVRSGRIPQNGYDGMLKLLETFLNPDFPVLPGKIDLDAMIGVHDEPQILEETRYLSREAWRELVDPHGPTFGIGPSLDELLEEERREWTASLRRMVTNTYCRGIDLSRSDPDDAAEFLASQIGDSFYRGVEIEPPMTIRMHLEIRYRLRQMARTVRAKEPYNPESKKKRNDGIDVDLYKYFILPAFAVVKEGGFFGPLEDIRSFQREWFIRPETLAARWLNGERPQPIWPDVPDRDN